MIASKEKSEEERAAGGLFLLDVNRLIMQAGYEIWPPPSDRRGSGAHSSTG
ncbi:hypothetical protein [Mesorhizobium sp. BHbdii]